MIRGHGQSPAAVEPVVDQGKEGVGESQVTAEGYHPQIYQTESPDVIRLREQQKPNSREECSHEHDWSRAKAVNEPSSDRADRSSFRSGHGKYQRNGSR